MCVNFDDDWARAGWESSGVYRMDRSFEEQFLQVGKDLSFSDLWIFVRSLEPNTYTHDNRFEEIFLYKMEENNFVDLESFDSTWSAINKTITSETFNDNSVFDDTFFEYSYGLLFEGFSKHRGKFENSELFENKFEEVKKTVQNELMKESVVSSSKTKSSNKRGLKSLLEMRLKRFKMMEDFMKTVKDSDTNIVTYVCKVCGEKSMWQRKLFYSHIKPKHIEASKKTTKKMRKCKKVPFESNVSRRYICEDLDCDKTFGNFNTRKRHMLSVHNGTRKFQCSMCKKSFRDKSDQQRHLKQRHHKYTCYKCPMCNFKSKYRNSLSRHQRKQHSPSNFDAQGGICCDICKKPFITVLSMRRHMRVHEAIKIGFDCVFCGNVKLENHLCIFVCYKCDRNFNCKSSLNSHLSIHRKLDDISKCINNISDCDELKSQVKSFKF